MSQRTQAAVDAAGAVRTRPTRIRQQTAGDGGGRASDVGALLHLQRTAGNRSVASLMTSQAPTAQRGLFDMLGGLLGGGGGGLQTQLAGLAGQGVQMGTQALGGSLGGPFGQILAGAGGGLGGAAASLVGGDTKGALAGLQSTGMAAATPLAQTGMGMLGHAVGGQAGDLLGGLGGAVGQGLSSVIGGGSPLQAGAGVLGAALPGLEQMAGRFLHGL